MDKIIIEKGIFPYSVQEAKEAGIKKEKVSGINKTMRFPNVMKDLRAKHGYTQQEVADLIEVTKSTIGLYETGDNIPDAKKLYKLAKLYNVSADYLLGLTDIKAPDPTTQAICNATGLSEEAVKTIINIYNESKKEGKRILGGAFMPGKNINTLNALLGNNFLRLFNKIMHYKRDIILSLASTELDKELSDYLDENGIVDGSKVSDGLFYYWGSLQIKELTGLGKILSYSEYKRFHKDKLQSELMRYLDGQIKESITDLEIMYAKNLIVRRAKENTQGLSTNIEYRINKWKLEEIENETILNRLSEDDSPTP